MSSEAWNSYPTELPLVNDPLSAFPEFKVFHDEQFAREMLTEIRDILLKAARSAFPIIDGAAILVQGGVSEDFDLYDSDTTKCDFRQEAYFQYLFGINEPDCYGLIDLKSGKVTLYVPEVSDDSQRYNGERRPLTYYTERYGVNETLYTKQIKQSLHDQSIKNLYLLHGENLDSGCVTKTTAKFDGIDEFVCDMDRLHPLLTELRVFKTPKEIHLMRLGNVISSQAHTYVMRHIKAGMTEIHLEAMFRGYCAYFGGARHMAYTCICGSGANGAVLHYGHAGRPNDRIFADGDTVVSDMGGEYCGYATDITRSYPVNGKFTEDQAAIHTAVYEAQTAVFKAMKPGVSWPDMHRLSERVILKHLLQIGIVKGDLEQMIANHVAAIFQPHGLGHLLGLNVHDVGGYHPGTSRLSEPGLCWLRCGRKLEAGMVITVEPGIYFNDPLIRKALDDPVLAPFLNMEVLERFRFTGGCRLEDDVLVTPTGIENFTVVPVTVQEIEKLMQRK